MVDTLPSSQAEVKAEMVGDTLGDAHALVEKVTDSLADVEAETLSHTLSDA